MPAKNTYGISDTLLYRYIHNKGINSESIFREESDFQMFTTYLKEYLSPLNESDSLKKTFTVRGRTFQGTPHQPKNYYHKIELVAYSLEPHQFHLILTRTDQKDIERFLRSLSTRYSIYFNKKYHHTGALFEGPYKSTQVSDNASLLLLTHHLHQIGLYSSLQNYVTNNVSWVRPKIEENNSKQFMKKHTFTTEEKTVLEKLIEKESKSVKNQDRAPDISGASVLEPQISRSTTNIPPSRHNISPTKFVSAAFSGFILLFTLGIKNVSSINPENRMTLTMNNGFNLKAIRYNLNSAYQNLENGIQKRYEIASSHDLKTPQVPPHILTPEVAGLQTDISSPTPMPTLSELPLQNEVPAPTQAVLEVHITDKSPFVNLRQGPTLASDIVGTAQDGDTFEAISKESGWYKIKLNDNTFGFISPKYSYLIEGDLTEETLE